MANNTTALKRSFAIVSAFLIGAFAGVLGLTSCATEKPLIENHQNRTTNPLLVKAKRPLERDLIETLEELRNRYRIPGLQVRVEKVDEPIFDITLGVRALGHQEAVTPTDQWHLASHTKVMTAVLVGQATERTNLTWQSRVGQVFKNDIPERIPLHASSRAITVDQLLSHQAGLMDQTKVLGGQLWAAIDRNDLPVSDLRLRLARGILASPLEFAPGTRTAYSNSAYIVLGHMAEVAFKTPWEDLVQKRIFAPLGMKSCGFGPAGVSSLDTPTQPWGHRRNTTSGEIETIPPRAPGADNPKAFGPAGTVHCSAQDWAKFLRIFFEDGDSRAWRAKILRKETLDHLVASAGNGMTFMSMQKIDRRSWAKGPVYVMAGNNTMNYSLSAIAPKASIAITINTNFGGREAEEGAQEILKLLASRIDN